MVRDYSSPPPLPLPASEPQPPSPPAACRVKVRVATELLTPFLMAMALTVVVAESVRGEAYRLLDSVGVLPSVV